MAPHPPRSFESRTCIPCYPGVCMNPSASHRSLKKAILRNGGWIRPQNVRWHKTGTRLRPGSVIGVAILLFAFNILAYGRTDDIQ
jgi:hypothetical protein